MLSGHTSGGGGRRLFTASQWQELEHQALIYKYMATGAPVPHDLVVPLRLATGVDTVPSLAFPPQPRMPYHESFSCVFFCSLVGRCCADASVSISPCSWVLGLLRRGGAVRAEGGGPGAGAVPADRRQEVAVLQGGPRRLQVLREAHPPRQEPFKKACGTRHRRVPPVRALHLAAGARRPAARLQLRHQPAPAPPRRRRRVPRRAVVPPVRPPRVRQHVVLALPRRVRPVVQAGAPGRGAAAAALPRAWGRPQPRQASAGGGE
jgi:hypothetical protein